MKKIGFGDKSDVFLLPDGRILKVFVPKFVALAPEEVEIAHQLERAGVNAPRVEEMREVDGRPGIVFGNLAVGTTLSSCVRKAPWSIVARARELAAQHAELHGHRSLELPSQHERIESEVRSSNVPAEMRNAALRVLEQLPAGDTVCHNDIHMQNVIVYPAGSMIIDWVLATRGNPLADVAVGLLQLRFGEQPRGFAARTALELGRAVFWRVYLQHYVALRRPDVAELARWELPVAVALAGRRAGRMRAQLVARIEALLSSGLGRPTEARS